MNASKNLAIAWGAAAGALAFALLMIVQNSGIPPAHAQTTSIQQIMICDPTATPISCAHVDANGNLMVKTGT